MGEWVPCPQGCGRLAYTGDACYLDHSMCAWCWAEQFAGASKPSEG